MSKVICDVCGTTYPETSSVCPICGCAKNTTEQTAADSAQQGEASSYTYVKGGRFSRSNVRKRNKKAKDVSRGGNQKPDSEERVNKGLVAVILILLLAIVAVLIYIGVRFLFPTDVPDPSENGASQTTGESISGTTSMPTLPEDIFCTGLKLSNTTIEFSEAGVKWQLSVEKEPKDTTDELTFTSSNEQVATVDETGNIVSVGGGEAVITVKCGGQSAECKILCNFTDPSQPTAQPTEPQVEIPAGFVLTLRHEEFTISKNYPDPVPLYKKNDNVKATDITWTVENPEVASVDENGVVSPVGKGYTVVRATIGDQTATCKVHVSFTPAQQTEAAYIISHKDVTLYIGGADSFRLTLETKEGVNVDAEWVASAEGYVTIDGKNITAVKPTADLPARSITLTATVEEQTYTCIVRVAEKTAEE